MIGIDTLDRLTSEQMIDIIEGKTKILVRDPKFIQTIVEEIPEPQLTSGEGFLPQETIITLLKMELESRAGWAYIRERITDSTKEKK